jgi:hypothetical protein
MKSEELYQRKMDLMFNKDPYWSLEDQIALEAKCQKIWDTKHPLALREELDLLRTLPDPVEFLTLKINEFNKICDQYRPDVKKTISEFPEESKKILTDMLEFVLPQEYRVAYERLHHLKKLRSALITKTTGTNDARKEVAKSVLIESLVTLEKARRGKKWITALCPLHTEKTPSFRINLQKNTFTCFGCGKHGDVIDFYQELTGKSFPDAVASLGGSK